MSTRVTCADCGYAGTYRTTALADFHFPRHSCRKERERQAHGRRIRARRANRDGIRRDCGHPIARHEHGTRQAYVIDKCRCAPCKTAARDYENARVRAKLYGRPARLVDAEPVRAHLRALMAQGTGYEQAAKLAGLSTTTVSQIIYGRPDRRDHKPPYRCDATIAAKIVAVQHDPWALPAGHRIDATGTHRRVQALVTLGWSQSLICQRIGMERGNFWSLMHNDLVTVRHAKAIRDLYEQLWNQPPPQSNQRERISVSRSRRHATEHGWSPPLAWDDDTIDNPGTAPHSTSLAVEELDEIAVERIMTGTLHTDRHARSPERIEAIRRLAALGYNDTIIAARVGMGVSAVGYTRIRHNILAGVNALTEATA